MKNIYFLLVSIFFSINLSAQWQSLGNDLVPIGYRVWSLKIASDNSMWAVSTIDQFPIPPGESPRVHISSDGGETWDTHLVDGVPGTTVWDIAPIDKNTAFVTTWSGILKTENGGTDWEFYDGLPNAARGFYAHFWNKNDGLILWDDAASTGAISLTKDGGNNWTDINPFDTLPEPFGTSFPPLETSESVGMRWYSTISEYSVRGDMMIMATGAGNYYFSKDKGFNWTKHETPFKESPRIISAIAFFDENTVMVSSDFDSESQTNGRSITHATNDGGVTWTQSFPEPVSGALHRVPGTQQSFILNGHNNFPWGKFGTYITHDLGATWERLDFTRTLAVFINDDDLGIGSCCNNSWFGAEGQIFKWENPLSDIAEKTKPLQIALTPNPTLDFIKISLENPILLRSAVAEIYEASGKLIFTKKITDSTGRFDVRQLESGLYFFNLKTSEGTYISKFVKHSNK